VTHPPYTAVLSTPTTNTNSIQNIAILSWMWYLELSRTL